MIYNIADDGMGYNCSYTCVWCACMTLHQCLLVRLSISVCWCDSPSVSVGATLHQCLLVRLSISVCWCDSPSVSVGVTLHQTCPSASVRWCACVGQHPSVGVACWLAYVHRCDMSVIVRP